jgi:hypothetical protein
VAILSNTQIPMQNYKKKIDTGKMKESKEFLKLLETDPKENKVYELPEKKIKIIDIKMLNELRKWFMKILTK